MTLLAESYVIYVCPECGQQHQHAETCPKFPKPGRFKPHRMYEVVPLRVVPLSAVLDCIDSYDGNWDEGELADFVTRNLGDKG